MILSIVQLRFPKVIPHACARGTNCEGKEKLTIHFMEIKKTAVFIQLRWSESPGAIFLNGRESVPKVLDINV